VNRITNEQLLCFEQDNKEDAPIEKKRNTCIFGTFITNCNLLGDEKKFVLIYQSAHIKSTYDRFAGLAQITKPPLGIALVHSTY